MRRIIYTLILSLIISTLFLCVKNPPKNYIYDNLVVEVDYYNNCYPYTESINWFKDQVDNIGICKKESILFVKDDSLGPKDYAMITIEELYATNITKKTYYNENESGKVLFLHLLGMRGLYELRAGPNDQHNVVGLTYAYDSIALFYPLARANEKIIMVHELLHVVLCDDPNQHCSDPKCIMSPIVMHYSLKLDAKCQAKINKLIDKSR